MEEFNTYSPFPYPAAPKSNTDHDPPVAMAYHAVPQSSDYPTTVTNPALSKSDGYHYPPANSNPAVMNSIISPQYCDPSPLDFAVVRKVMTVSDGNFVVEDINGNVIFKVKGALLSIRDRRVLLDAAGSTVVTLRKKVISTHDRWQAFRGESTELGNLIFTVKRSSMFQLKTKLDVFLANNPKEDVCDFKIKGSWLERSCVVYAGESSTIVAQMCKKRTVKSVLIGKDKFMVTVYPNADYAFVIALIVILDAINSDS